MKVITFGELLLRLASPGYTKLMQKDCLETSFCGGEANVAVSLSIFGVESVYVTKLPLNDIGRAAGNSLRYFGVDTSKIIYGKGRMGLYYLEKGASQRPSKVIYDREYSALALSSAAEYDWEAIFDSVDWFHFTGITPALSNELADICIEACKVAKAKGIKISCDLNYRKQLWSEERARSVMAEIMPFVDVCIANEEDMQKTLGISVCGTNVETAELNIGSYCKAAREIRRLYGCKYVAITLRKSFSASRNGWSAMLYNSEHDSVAVSKEYDIQLVDRVGGGDSFSAGLIYSMLLNKDDCNAVDFAVAASCLKQSIEGDFNRTTVEEVNSLVSGSGNGRVLR